MNVYQLRTPIVVVAVVLCALFLESGAALATHDSSGGSAGGGNSSGGTGGIGGGGFGGGSGSGSGAPSGGGATVDVNGTTVDPANTSFQGQTGLSQTQAQSLVDTMSSWGYDVTVSAAYGVPGISQSVSFSPDFGVDQTLQDSTPTCTNATLPDLTLGNGRVMRGVETTNSTNGSLEFALNTNAWFTPLVINASCKSTKAPNVFDSTAYPEGANGSFSFQVRIDWGNDGTIDETIKHDAIGPLGGWKSVTSPTDKLLLDQVGTHRYVVVVDPHNSCDGVDGCIVEPTFDYSNVRAGTFTVVDRNQPDLLPYLQTVYEVGMVGAPMDLPFVIGNIGVANAAASEYRLTIDDDASVGNGVVSNHIGNAPALAPGDSPEITETWTPTSEGVYYLRVVVDRTDAVTEINESNNVSDIVPIYVVDVSAPTCAANEVDISMEWESYQSGTQRVVDPNCGGASHCWPGHPAYYQDVPIFAWRGWGVTTPGAAGPVVLADPDPSRVFSQRFDGAQVPGGTMSLDLYQAEDRVSDTIDFFTIWGSANQNGGYQLIYRLAAWGSGDEVGAAQPEITWNADGSIASIIDNVFGNVYVETPLQNTAGMQYYQLGINSAMPDPADGASIPVVPNPPTPTPHCIPDGTPPEIPTPLTVSFQVGTSTGGATDWIPVSQLPVVDGSRRVVVKAGEEVGLQYSTAFATQCTNAGTFTFPNPKAAGQFSGTLTDSAAFDEPIIFGQAKPIYYQCSGVDGSTKTRFVEVYLDGGPTITADPRVVRRGETTTLTWNLNGNLGCSLIGPNVTRNSLSAVGSETVAVESLSQYVISCSNGSNPNAETSVEVAVTAAFEER